MTDAGAIFTSHQVAGVGPFEIATDPGNDDDMHRGIREYRQFLHSTIHYAVKRLKPGQRFVDAGANLGTYSIPVAFNGCHVLAIEAAADNYVLLSRSALKNKLTALIPVHAAVFDRAGVVNLAGASAWTAVTAATGGPVVPALRLDDLLDLHGLSLIHI